MLPVIWFVGRLWIGIHRARLRSRNPNRLLVIDAMTGAVVGTAVAAVISAPMITNVDFYLALALLIGTIGRVEYEAGQAAPAPDRGWRTA
jgi:hypothetical protein